MTISKELLDELLKGCERPEDLLGDTGLMKDLRIKLMERMLGAELTAHLGYEEGKDAPPGQANRRNGTASSVRGNGLPRRWLHGLATTFVQSDPERVWSRTHSTPCLEDHQPNAVGHDGQRRDRRAPDQDKPEQLAAHVSGSLRRAASCRGRPSRHRRCSPG